MKTPHTPPGNEPEAFGRDPWLAPYRAHLERRRIAVKQRMLKLCAGRSPADFAAGHQYYGLHCDGADRVFREWAPNASAVFLVGDFSGWRVLPEFRLARINANGDWELRLPAAALRHGMHYRLRIEWPGGGGDRLPAYARYVVQDETTTAFTALVWEPSAPYVFRHASPPRPPAELVYESHIGMAQEEAKIGTFREYRENILPVIAASGYHTIQLMGIMNHPYYGSFGYHVANFFSISSRFGTPEEFKELVDAAHGMGLRVIIDLVHSHAVRNEQEGLSRFDGVRSTYFHDGGRGEHLAWDSLCFDYGKDQVLHFLLSNCRFYLDEYQLDGFRFDGVTSMLYRHHGLGVVFSGYDDYFGDQVDEDALTYLALANAVIHELRPDAVTVAEDVSGMPGLAAPLAAGGIGFDYRLAMGVTDMWFKLFDLPDENWDMRYLYGELTNRRRDERTISYVECHDQAIVGGQTAIFRLAGAAMYDFMRVDSRHLGIDRAAALHKMVRLVTAATAGHGYLNFMGNEFGHPEWVDFPREGNHWSCAYARRQWSLAADPALRYAGLLAFDRAMLKLLGDDAFFRCAPQLMRCDNESKILIFERAGRFFFFNFHPAVSAADCAVEAPPGEYELLFDSDAPAFGGFGRIAPGQRRHTRSLPGANGGTYQALTVYLPCRTALVFKRI
jgi:1,4-alpha-glucan branching enzyme